LKKENKFLDVPPSDNTGLKKENKFLDVLELCEHFAGTRSF
jgi:hypothetical protein